ncbi:putative peptidase [Acidovorax soli]|uniref:Putative peptidase n=1 Tax=Acidovorax soli TaxID=592050 RepID=A0A7X0PKX9_9BURK|nr:hypothetical protein [Acidovorax soli]MBB6563868.1 putative peptidase [Acidovorax soli]
MKTTLAAAAAATALVACGGGSDTDSATPSGQFQSRSAAQLQALTPAERQVAKSFASSDGTQVPYLEYLPSDYATSGTKTYPLLMFLHGGSGAGKSNGSEISKLLGYPIPAMIAANNEMCFADQAGVSQCFIVVSPQSPRTTGVWNLNDAGGMLLRAQKSYRVDPSRIYVTGVSMGGGGTWTLLASSYTENGQSVRWASKIAAAMPIATGAKSSTYNTGICAGIVGNSTPVWAFHNSGDPIAALANERGWVDKVNLATSADGYTCAQPGNPAARLTIYQGNTHEGWTTTYNVNTLITPGMNAFQWLLSNKKP